MNESFINDLYCDYPDRVTLTDQEFERRFKRHDGWTELVDSNNLPVGGESRVYFTSDGLYVIKTPIEYDVDSGEILTDSEMEDIFETKYDQLLLEFSLPHRHRNLTTTISVSPKYTAELKRGQSLPQYIDSRNIPTLLTRLNMCIDVFTGVKVIHSNTAAHLDIKPDNIFVNDGKLTIGDFGSIMASNSQETGASIDWSPNRFSRKRPREIDMYSSSMVCIGILAWEPDIISQCGHFRHSLNNVQNMNETCNLLERVFDDVCFFPGEVIPQNFIEDLKNGLLGLECNSLLGLEGERKRKRARSFQVIRSLQQAIRSISP